MRGKKAKAIRKRVYGHLNETHGRNRSYFLTNRRERKVEVPARPYALDANGKPVMTEVTMVTHTVVADQRRRAYQGCKRFLTRKG